MKKYGKDNPHPRGFIGELYANQLLEAGYREITVGLDDHFWVSPDDDMLGGLEFAFKHLKESLLS